MAEGRLIENTPHLYVTLFLIFLPFPFYTQCPLLWSLWFLFSLVFLVILSSFLKCSVSFYHNPFLSSVNFLFFSPIHLLSEHRLLPPGYLCFELLDMLHCSVPSIARVAFLVFRFICNFRLQFRSALGK